LLLEKEPDELYHLLGAELLGESIGFGPADFRRQVDFGRQWLRERLRMLRRTVCLDGRVQQMIIANKGDLVAECAAVLDIVSNRIDLPKTPVLAVLVVRLGLSGFCAGDVQPED
jgi:hypothetical protein